MTGAGQASGSDRPDLLSTRAYDYELPPELIARYPAPRREDARLLVVRPEAEREVAGEAASPALTHRTIPGLVGLLRAGDLLVLNETRVLPVRLLGHKPTGAACEVLLLEPYEDDRVWSALVRPGSKLKPGRRVVISPELSVAIEDGLPGGARRVRLETPLPVEEALERFGRVPLPPYLEREAEPLDRERYQTVYARVPGSVAAPTAGLHLTPELLDAVEAKGVEVARVTLHVGPGTFRPVEADRVTDHEMHAERWEVSEAAASAITRTRANGGRVWAVGTTVIRTLESAALEHGASSSVVAAGAGSTRLFISPGFEFQVVDGLITNFHLPRSTLLMLVSALAGYDRIREAYRAAVDEGYRFYSYGDAMVILPR